MEEQLGNLAQEIQMVVGSFQGGNRLGWYIRPAIVAVARVGRMVLGAEGQHLGEELLGAGRRRCMVKGLVQAARNHLVRPEEVHRRAFFPWLRDRSQLEAPRRQGAVEGMPEEQVAPRERYCASSLPQRVLSQLGHHVSLPFRPS